MNQRYTLCFLLLVFSGMGQLRAQQTFNASAGHAILGGKVQHSYSVGEMTLVHTATTSSARFTQGFLQPVQISVENTGQTVSGEGLENLKVYPNPTRDLLHVECWVNESSRLTYQLFDAAAHLIINKTVSQKEGQDRFSIDLRPFAAGTYFLVIRKDSEDGTPSSYTYKIQKSE